MTLTPFARTWKARCRARSLAGKPLAAEGLGRGDLTAAEVTAGYFHPREPKYDPGMLEKLVPADVLRKCAPGPAAKDAFWVRKARR